MPSRRHNRQTGPLYLAMLFFFAHNAEARRALSNLSPLQADEFRCSLRRAFLEDGRLRPAYSLTKTIKLFGAWAAGSRYAGWAYDP